MVTGIHGCLFMIYEKQWRFEVVVTGDVIHSRGWEERDSGHNNDRSTNIFWYPESSMRYPERNVDSLQGNKSWPGMHPSITYNSSKFRCQSEN